MSHYSKKIRSDSGFVYDLPKQEITLSFKYHSVVFTKNQKDYTMKDIKYKNIEGQLDGSIALITEDNEFIIDEQQTIFIA